MEQYLKAKGIPFARDGPASKRKSIDKKKVLKQTRLPPTTAASPGSLKSRRARKDHETTTTKAPYFRPVSDSASDSTIDAHQDVEHKGRSSKEYFRPISDSECDVHKPVKRARDASPQLPSQDSDYHLIPGPSPSRNARGTKRTRQSRIRFPPGGDRFISSDPVDSEDEEFRATQLAPTPDRRASGRTTSPLPSHAIDLESDSDVEIVQATVPANDRKRLVQISSDSDDSEEGLVTPMRRRRRFMPPDRPGSSEPSIGDRQSSQLAEALEDARDLDNKLIKTSRHRSTNVKKDNFRNSLARLRRKKAGLASDSDEDENGGGEEEGDGSDSQSFRTTQDNDTYVQNADADADDWIVEDEFDRDALLDNLPEVFQQPRQPLEQFKIAIQWEILDLLMPQGGLAPDSYFKPAISWLRDRTVDGAQAAISSIWRRPYVRALRRGPELGAVETGNLGAYCDACGRTNRIATYVCKFQGSRYDHATLDDLSSDAESSEDDLDVDEDALSDIADERARKERILRAEWNLGVNCYERTCVAHELFHLRKHLRDEVHDKLRHMGLFSAAKTLERSVLAKSQRIELANQVTEQLDNERFQQRLWTRL